MRPTIFAEAYFNFDLIGVFLLAAIIGGLLGRLSSIAERLMQNPNQRERLFGLMCVFMYFEFFFRLQQTPGIMVSYIEAIFVLVGLFGALIVRKLTQAQDKTVVLSSGKPALEGVP